MDIWTIVLYFFVWYQVVNSAFVGFWARIIIIIIIKRSTG